MSAIKELQKKILLEQKRYLSLIFFYWLIFTLPCIFIYKSSQPLYRSWLYKPFRSLIFNSLIAFSSFTIVLFSTYIYIHLSFFRVGQTSCFFLLKPVFIVIVWEEEAGGLRSVYCYILSCYLYTVRYTASILASR